MLSKIMLLGILATSVLLGFLFGYKLGLFTGIALFVMFTGYMIVRVGSEFDKAFEDISSGRGLSEEERLELRAKE